MPGEPSEEDRPLINISGSDFLGFGIDQHARRRSMHAALGFGDRYPLHAVHAAFEFQARPHTVRRVALETGEEVDALTDSDLLSRAKVLCFGARPATSVNLGRWRN